MGMSNQKDRSAWKRWHDPRATEKDYDRWREQHRALVRERVMKEFYDEVRIPEGAPVALVAAVTGLSTSTVSTYVRKRTWGKRGPLMTTYKALLLMNRTVR